MLTPKQLAIIAYTEANPRATQGQVAKAVGLTRESVNRLIARARKNLGVPNAPRNRIAPVRSLSGWDI